MSRDAAIARTQAPPQDAGFTLAELLVASILLTLVLAGAYTAFSSSIRLWRIGEANVATYQDGRMALSILERELEHIPAGIAYLMEGDDRELQFFAVTEPMDVDKDVFVQPLRILYRLKRVQGKRGSTLIREERAVEGALPPEPEANAAIDDSTIKLSRARSFAIAEGVRDLRFEYCWIPTREDGRPAAPESDGRVRLVVKERHERGWRLPQGIRITLAIEDSNAEKGETTFSTFVTFRGPMGTLKKTQAALSETQEGPR